MSSSQADVQVLVQLMHTMNVQPEELLAAARPQNVPTFEEFMPLVRAAASPGLQRSYKSYWDRIVECWGGRRLNEPTPRDVDDLLEHIRANALRRRTHVDGAGAVRNGATPVKRASVQATGGPRSAAVINTAVRKDTT